MSSGNKTQSISGFEAFLPYLLILGIGVVWGMTFSLARIAAEAGAHPIGLAFWQAAGGGLVLLPICLIRRSVMALNWQNCKRFLVIGLAGTAIPGTLFFYAAAHVPAGVLAITIALVPMQTYAIAWALRIDQYQRKRFVGIILGFSAILLLSIPESSLPEPGMVKWLLLALVASVFYTIENIYVDMSIPQGTDLIALLMAGLFVAALVLAPVIYIQDTFVPIRFPFQEVEWAIFSMAFVSSAAYAAFLFVIKIAGSVFASLSGYTVTLSGVFWGMVFFDETHSIWVWIALVLMLAGMVLVTPRQRTGSTV